jgi:hypothetical protein
LESVEKESVMPTEQQNHGEPGGHPGEDPRRAPAGPATGAFPEAHGSCAVTRLLQPRRDENDRDRRDLKEIRATGEGTDVVRTTRALISSLRRVPRWSRRTSAAGGAEG